MDDDPDEDADARDMRQEAILMRLLDGLDRLDHRERGIRKATDQLTLDPFADAGPTWLDWLISARTSVLPSVIGAIGRSMMLSQMIATPPDPDPARCTIGMMDVTREVEDRPISPTDWHLFLPYAQILRWSDCNTRLRRAIDGLTLLCRGGRMYE